MCEETWSRNSINVVAFRLTAIRQCLLPYFVLAGQRFHSKTDYFDWLAHGRTPFFLFPSKPLPSIRLGDRRSGSWQPPIDRQPHAHLETPIVYLFRKPVSRLSLGSISAEVPAHPFVGLCSDVPLQITATVIITDKAGWRPKQVIHKRGRADVAHCYPSSVEKSEKRKDEQRLHSCISIFRMTRDRIDRRPCLFCPFIEVFAATKWTIAEILRNRLPLHALS